jgi:hypothetical protein
MKKYWFRIQPREITVAGKVERLSDGGIADFDTREEAATARANLMHRIGTICGEIEYGEPPTT